VSQTNKQTVTVFKANKFTVIVRVNPTGPVISYIAPSQTVGVNGWPGILNSWSNWFITGVVSDVTQGTIWFTAAQTLSSGVVTQHLIRSNSKLTQKKIFLKKICSFTSTLRLHISSGSRKPYTTILPDFSCHLQNLYRQRSTVSQIPPGPLGTFISWSFRSNQKH
jgi:hypothetical protein